MRSAGAHGKHSKKDESHVVPQGFTSSNRESMLLQEIILNSSAVPKSFSSPTLAAPFGNNSDDGDDDNDSHDELS